MPEIVKSGAGGLAVFAIVGFIGSGDVVVEILRIYELQTTWKIGTAGF